MDLTLQQIVEGLPKSLLNATDKDLEGFQKIIEETIKLRKDIEIYNEWLKTSLPLHPFNAPNINYIDS